MNTLYGYVRELQFDSDTCTVCVPNLYYRRFDKMLEARIEIDNLGKELVDYLEKQGRLLKDQIDGTNNLPFRIISLHELKVRFDDELLADNPPPYKFCRQLETIINQCEAIAAIGGLFPDSVYLEFTIS